VDEVKNTRTRVAAAATILGLGGLAGVALNAGSKTSTPVGVKPLVRTKVIRQTVHVTKHIKPKRPAAGGTPGSPYRSTSTTTEPVGGVTTASSSTGSAPPSSSPAPVTTSSSGAAAPAPSSESAPVVTHTSGSSAGSGGGTSAPVVTHTSGAGGGGGGEREGGDKGD
jgi:hypothetical protein